MVQERGWCVCVLCINRERRMIQMWQSANILGIWGRGRRDFLVLFCNFFVSKIFWKDFAYLVLERGEGREKERERNINVWLPLVHPHRGPSPQPRQVPWLGSEPVTLWFAGWHSIHWVTPARAVRKNFWSMFSFRVRNTFRYGKHYSFLFLQVVAQWSSFLDWQWHDQDHRSGDPDRRWFMPFQYQLFNLKCLHILIKAT